MSTKSSGIGGLCRAARTRATAVLATTAALGAVAGALAPGAAAEGPNAVRTDSAFFANSLARNDDSSTGRVAIGFPINFFGGRYSQLFVNNNGNVTFDAALGDFTPSRLRPDGIKIIAAFFADVDTRNPGSEIVRYGWGQGVVDGHRAFAATYRNVGYFSSGADKLNSFQIVLIQRDDTGAPGNENFDIELNYDKVQWEAGSASGGTNGLGGTSARAGYSSGLGQAFELDGSGVNGAFLDSSAGGLIKRSLNTGQLGRYLFAVRDGSVVTPVDTTPPVITTPADRVAEATSPAGATVTYPAATAVDATDGARPVTCAPASGTAFPLGQTTVTCKASDTKGNEATKSFSVTVRDSLAPTIEGTATPAANEAGWHRGDVDVRFACTDGGTGVVACEDDVPLREETSVAGRIVPGVARDGAGNTARTEVGPIRIDRTSPTLSGAATEPANAQGWYRGDVTIAWTAEDGLSGIAPGATPASVVLRDEGRGVSAGPQTVLDRAGNASAPTTGPSVQIDRTPPSVVGAPTSAPNAAGWHRGAVTVGFTCADELSGVQDCPAARVLSDDGRGQSVEATGSDAADNARTVRVEGIDIDSRAPVSSAVLVCTGDEGVCREDRATVRFGAEDPAPAPGVLTSGVVRVEHRLGTSGDWVEGTEATVPLSGSGTATVQHRATDAAGNVEDPRTATIRFDTIAPTVTHVLDPVANAAGWQRADTTVRFSATDAHPDDAGDTAPSGILDGSLTPDVLVADETAGRVVEGSAQDRAGNVGRDSVTVRLDETAPTVGATTSGTRGANGWWTSAVGVDFTCADPGDVASGVVSCTPQRSLGHRETVTGKAVDAADNEAGAAVGPFDVDGDAPRIDVAGVRDGGIYTLGAVPAASCTATDVGPSGVDGGCAVEVTGGRPNGVGTFAYTARAKDVAGNATVVRGTYAVRYLQRPGTAFWRQPINDTAHTTGSTTSVFKAGSTVPAKFRLLDAAGRTVQASAAPQWLVPVRGRAMSSPVDEAAYGLAETSASVFTWDGVEQHYQHNWQSPRTGAGWFWRIGVALDDGTTRTVSIGLR